MVYYKLSIKTKGNPDPNDVFEYQVDLSTEHENAPEYYFGLERKEDIQKTLENKTDCRVNSQTLNQIISEWIDDISIGYRDTTLTLDLPPLDYIDPHNFEDTGNPELPPFQSPNLDGIIPNLFVLPPLTFH
jgi:hypothetical protein